LDCNPYNVRMLPVRGDLLHEICLRVANDIPGLSEADAERIGQEARRKRSDHIYIEANE